MIHIKHLSKKIKASVVILTSVMLCIPLLANPRTAEAKGKSILFGAWSGSTTTHAGSFVEFQVVDAHGISFNLSGYDSFRFQIDGGSPRRVGSGWYDLEPGTHEICLFTENVYDKAKGVRFNSAEIYGGSFAPSEKEQYLFIGDSLWEGTNSLGMGAGQDSFINSIPYQLGKNMNVVPVTVAAPGSGIFQSEIYGTIEDMIYQSEINADPTRIFISAGTNDLKLGIPEDMELYAFQNLVDTIASMFPYSQIYVVVPFYGQCYSNVIYQLSGVTVIDTTGWPMEYTDGFHPTGDSAKYAADIIAGMLW